MEKHKQYIRVKAETLIDEHKQTTGPKIFTAYEVLVEVNHQIKRNKEKRDRKKRAVGF